MADDIVTRLDCAYPRHGTTDCELCTFCLTKAEIERLRAENVKQKAEILRLESLHWSTQMDNALLSWKEARRG